MLPDVALLEIFDFYVHATREGAWYKLVHVCRKWRDVVFGSPGRLDLRLYCNEKTPVRKMLEVWPPLPIVIRVHAYGPDDDSDNPMNMDEVVAALKHNDRVCYLRFQYGYYSLSPNPQVERVLAAMHQPFPALTFLQLGPEDETAPIDANSFLGGSAPPNLQTLKFFHLPFPGLPKLLLSATHLVTLSLSAIPHSGYISPEAMVTGLSALTSLERLEIGFESPKSRPLRRRPPPPTRTTLPVLKFLDFDGVSEYLEDLLAQIDAPLLHSLRIAFFHQLIFDTPQLTLFISRTPKFNSKVHDALLDFSSWIAWVKLAQTIDGALSLATSCKRPDWQLSSIAQLCSSSFPQALILGVEHLYIHENGFWTLPWDDIESSQWLELLHPFNAVKDLYISPKFMSSIAPALQELAGERVTEVLPALQTLFLEKLPEKPVQEAIEKFVSARQLSGHPIAVSRWENKAF